MKARPVIAGLKILWPKPPNTIFPNIMAKTMPMIRMCHGIVGGKMSAYIIAETNTASVTGSFLGWVKMYSVKKATAHDTSTMNKDRQPKKYVAAIIEGINASIIRRMISCFISMRDFPFLMCMNDVARAVLLRGIAPRVSIVTHYEKSSSLQMH